MELPCSALTGRRWSSCQGKPLQQQVSHQRRWAAEEPPACPGLAQMKSCVDEWMDGCRTCRHIVPLGAAVRQCSCSSWQKGPVCER